jgi:polar amino acid transport system substrate-binding protein
MSPRHRHLRIFSVLALAGLTASTHAATLAEIQQRGYMVVAVSDAASPFAITTQDKRIGFDAELLDRLRRSVSVEIRVETVPDALLTARLQNGDVDAVATSLEITTDRQKSVDFTPPVAENTFYYLRRRGDAHIGAVADLGNRRLGIHEDAASVLAMTELEHSLAKAGSKPLGATTEYPSEAEAYRALAKGRVDYVINDIEDLAQAAKSRSAAFAVGQPVAHKTYVAWAVAKDNADLAVLFKNFMLQERSGGDLAKLQQKWLGWSFPELPDSVAVQDWWTTRSDRPSEFPIPTPKDPD